MKSLFLLACIAFITAIVGCGKTDEAKEKDFADTMAREHAGDKPTGNDVAWLEPAQPVDTQQVSYASLKGAPIYGYLALPATGDSGIPGLIVIHEWWGLNDNIKAMARRIAGEGYMALAVDLYDGKVATTPEEAKSYVQGASADPDKGLMNLQEAINTLKSKGATKIGVIGWCFGGGWSLQTGLNFPKDIDATVIYYGQLETDPNKLKKLDMPVLGIFGAEDRGISPEKVNGFKSILDSLGINSSIHIYPNANHAFANPSGERYNAEAAKDAWGKTIAFLAEHLK